MRTCRFRGLVGCLSAVIVLLFYFFISSAVLMFGAEVNAQIYHHVAGSEDAGGKW